MSNTQNTLIAEDKAYEKWERATKNRILSIVNEERKTAEWNRLFPKREIPSDDYLDGEIF